MPKQIDYRNLIFTLLFDLVHGEEADPYDVSDEEIEKIAWVAENVVRITLLSTQESLDGGFSVCELCECRVDGPMTQVKGASACPGCARHMKLLDEVMRRGLGTSYNQEMSSYD